MKQDIYERDFAEEHKQQLEQDIFCHPTQQEISNFLFMYQSTGEYVDELATTPRVTTSEMKENYDRLLHNCEAFTRRIGGSIRGIIDYENYDASIEVILPFAEFSSQDELALLKEISQEAVTVLFENTNDGKIRMLLTIDYFQCPIPVDEINAHLSEAYQMDLARISVIKSFVSLPEDVQRTIPQFAHHIIRIADAATISPDEALTKFVKELKERGIDFLDLKGFSEIAEEIIKSFE